jgi:molybdate transport system ATP-binding protein
MAADPALLLLDEPLAALDVDVTPALRTTLRTVLAGRTAVIATHDVLDAVLLADTVAVLDGAASWRWAPPVTSSPATQQLRRPHRRAQPRHRHVGRRRRPHPGRPHRPWALSRVRPRGTPMVAVFRPAAVAIYRETLPGCARTACP